MKKVVNCKVDTEEWKKEQDKVFNKLNKQANIKGFRPGKAPREMFEKKYGEGEILSKAADKFVNEKYTSILSEGKIIPILEPKVDIVKLDKDNFEFNLTLILNPEVELGDYKNLKAKKEKVTVTKKEIDKEIDHLLDHYAEIIEKDGKVENGDTAIIDFEGFKDGVAFEGGKAENYPLEIGSNSFIPGFEDGIIGMSKGEEKELKLTFPKDYMSEELKGKKVVFKVKVNEIKTRQVPELDKNFFEDLDMEGVNSKEELESKMKENIASLKEEEAEKKYTDAILEEISNNSKIDIDEEIIDLEVNSMYERFLDNLSYQGLDEEMYYKFASTSKEEILEKMRPQAETQLRHHYVIQAILDKENITIDDEEIEKEIEKEAEKYGITKEEVYKELDYNMYRYHMTNLKVIDFIKENNKK